jgi:hypothetical protein
LLAVAPYVEDEVCGVSFHHQRPVSGGGRWHCCRSFLTVPTPVLLRKTGIDRRNCRDPRRTAPSRAAIKDCMSRRYTGISHRLRAREDNRIRI